MATFGYTTIGAAYSALNDTICGGKDTCPVEGEAQSITVYLKGWAAGEKVKCAIYNADKTFIKTTEERTTGGGDGWYVFNFAAPKPSLSASTDYILLAWADSVVDVAADTGAPANSQWYQSAAYNNYPDPIGDPTSSSKKSIYCTYTPTITNYTSTLTAAIGLSATLTPQKDLLRTQTTSIGLSSSLSPQKNLFRTLTTEIGLTSSLVRIHGWVRSLTTAIGLTSSFSAQKDLLRTQSTSMGLSSSLSPQKNLLRTLSATIGLSPILSAQKDLFRALTTPMGLSAILSAQKDLLRTLSTSVGLSAILSAQKNLFRTLTASIGLYSLVRWVGRMKRRIASIGTNRTIGDVGTNREVTTTGENRDREDF